MKIEISFLIIFILLGCKGENASSNKRDNISEKIETEIFGISKDSIIGYWTDGSSENATFEIKPNSIYYVENFEDFDYQLKIDTIEIKYPDYVYRAKIVVINDSLIMNSKEYGQSKFVRFEE